MNLFVSIKRFLKEVRDIIMGTEQDYTSIPLRWAIVMLAIPMVLEMIFEAMFAIVDIYFVSHLGDNSTTVVGLTESLMTMVYAIGMGVSMGTTGIVSRRIGEHNPAEASKSAAQAMLLGIILSLLFSIPGILYPEKILYLMHASPEVIESGRTYTRIMLGGNVIIMLLFIHNAVFRSAGNPALSMWVLIFANLVNMILDPCLILGLGPFPKLGVTGAAVATTTGRTLAVLIQLYLLFSGKGRIKILMSYFRIQVKIMWKVLYLSGGGILQFLITTSSWIFLYRILARYNSEVVAGYTIGIRLFIFFLLPAWGLSNAVSTLVGQNLGANNPERALKSVWATAIANVSYMIVIMVLFLTIPQFFVQFFGTSEKSFDVAIRCMRIVSLGNIFYGLQMVIAQAFNGAGDTYTPTLLNFIAFWLIEIPLAVFLSLVLDWQEDGVFYAIFIAETLLSLISLYIFSKGKWKLKKV
jgi:putative MATE family efflux protein